MYGLLLGPYNGAGGRIQCLVEKGARSSQKFIEV